jgi:hypothetical protein
MISDDSLLLTLYVCFHRDEVCGGWGFHAGSMEKRERIGYPSDVTNEEWAFVAPTWRCARTRRNSGAVLDSWQILQHGLGADSLLRGADFRRQEFPCSRRSRPLSAEIWSLHSTWVGCMLRAFDPWIGRSSSGSRTPQLLPCKKFCKRRVNERPRIRGDPRTNKHG